MARKFQIVNKRDVFFYLCCIGICSVIGLFAPLNWFCDLFTHFRPQAVLGALVILPVAWFLKDRRSVILAFCIMALNGAIIGKGIYDFHLPATSTAVTQPVSIISANIFMGSGDYSATIKMLDEYKPDIFVALEVDDAWMKGLKEIEAEYPHRLQVPRDDYFGMAIYSRFPFEGKELEVGVYGATLLRADFADFTLFTLHPPPPAQPAAAAELSRYLAEMSQIAQKTTKPLAVAGDMNTTLWSDNAKYFKAAGLKSPSAGFAWTWPAGFFPLAIQIDHIFVRDLAVKSFTALSGINSDHYPVRAELLVPAKP
ncbi:MAG: endonuclease/exonuclease/phosphatase family protein [Alphaproteobacteria bacterium]